MPFRILIAEIGDDVDLEDPVTEETRDAAFAYFIERDHDIEKWKTTVPADGPKTAVSPAVYVAGRVYPKEWPTDPGLAVLQNNYPAPISVHGHEYPTVTHAYWALSAADTAHHVCPSTRHSPRC
jgi:hypothetical protein